MEDYSAYTDEELIMRIHNGKNDHGDNNEIMDYILEKYKPLVRKKTNALYLIGGENDDLIQEGMIGLFKAVRDYKSDKEASFYSFAQLCITRQLSSALEASNRKKHMPLNTYISFSQSDSDGTEFEEMLQDDIASPEQLLIEKEKFKEFKEQLWNKLSNMEKKVLQLYLEGNNYTSIAHMLGKSDKSIDNALSRIRQKLKRK